MIFVMVACPFWQYREILLYWFSTFMYLILQ